MSTPGSPSCRLDDIEQEGVLRFDHGAKTFAVYRAPGRQRLVHRRALHPRGGAPRRRPGDGLRDRVPEALRRLRLPHRRGDAPAALREPPDLPRRDRRRRSPDCHRLTLRPGPRARAVSPALHRGVPENTGWAGPLIRRIPTMRTTLCTASLARLSPAVPAPRRSASASRASTTTSRRCCATASPTGPAARGHRGAGRGLAARLGKQLSQVNNFIASGVDAIIVTLADTSAAPASPRGRGGRHPARLPQPRARECRELPDDAGLCRLEGGRGRHARRHRGLPLARRHRARTRRARLYHDGRSRPQRGAAADPSRTRLLATPDVQFITDHRRAAGRLARAPRAMDLMTNWLTAGEPFDAVFANNDEMAIGAIQAMKARASTWRTSSWSASTRHRTASQRCVRATST